MSVFWLAIVWVGSFTLFYYLVIHDSPSCFGSKPSFSVQFMSPNSPPCCSLLARFIFRAFLSSGLLRASKLLVIQITLHLISCRTALFYPRVLTLSVLQMGGFNAGEMAVRDLGFHTVSFLFSH